MPVPIITFLTDFGAADHYAAVMKGVILRIAPEARFVDITHEVQPFAIAEAGFLLAQAYPYFPPKSIHVIVVDPGVGSARRPILAEAEGHYFIAPDNGVLSMALEGKTSKVRHISNTAYLLESVSATFHGRDVFAPVAGHLASGVKPARFGKLIGDHIQLAVLHPLRTGRHIWTGTVLHVDRFGNLITNFKPENLDGFADRPFQLAVGLTAITRLARNYAEVAGPEPFAIIGSSGYLEVSIREGSAARKLGCSAGSRAELTLY